MLMGGECCGKCIHGSTNHPGFPSSPGFYTFSSESRSLNLHLWLLLGGGIDPGISDHAYGIDRCILVIKQIIRHSIARYSCLLVKLALPDVFPVSCCLRGFHSLYTFADWAWILFGFTPPQNRHKSRFIGIPCANVMILVVTVTGWEVDPRYYLVISSPLKLTAKTPAKMDGWKTSQACLLEMAQTWQVLFALTFRECRSSWWLEPWVRGA